MRRFLGRVKRRIAYQRLRRLYRPSFDHDYYLRQNADVRDTGIDPLEHFLMHGKREGRKPNANAMLPHIDAGPRSAKSGSNQTKVAPKEDAFQIARITDEFDENFYQAQNSKVFASKSDMIAHYLEAGFQMGLDPNPEFSTRYYLQSNADVALSGINPFYHYVSEGRREGRQPLLSKGWIVDSIRAATSPKHPNHVEDQPGLSALELANKFREAALDRASRLAISVSHDDYRHNTGGIQALISVEVRFFRERGWSYIHLSPSIAATTLAYNCNQSAFFLFHVTCNGEEIGLCSDVALLDCIKDIEFAQRRFIIHALHGHQVDAILRVVACMNLNSATFWVHDYFSICPNHTLLRNDVVFCQAPPDASQACTICVYGRERRRASPEIKRLFASLAMDVLTPSRVALDLWLRESGLRCTRALVVPHGFLIQTERRRTPPRSAGQYRIAFLGHPASHKGWPTFAELASRFRADPRYAFFHFGTASRLPSVQFVPVRVTGADRRAMIDALEAHDIDVAVIWSIYPESFCFAAHEALAAGALIVTGAASGNVAVLATEHGAGLVFDDEAALFPAFADGAIGEAVEAHRARGIGYDFKWNEDAYDA